MANDIARLSYDRGRGYTGVVKLQGRVALEADDNEQRIIAAEERRKELIEIVGPAGTPNGGYALTQTKEQQQAPGDLTIGVGTMYVGGMRVELDEAITLRHQPDWLDQPESLSVTSGHVLLMLEETDVTAVEDPVLREAALGGPDSADRTRLLQHIDIIPTQDTSCAAALDDDTATWATQGLEFEPTTMRLNSASRLKASWEGGQPQPNPCEPNNLGGYLGAENQLVRVQVAAVDAQAGTFDLLWGWDNASMLYQVTAATNDTALLTLQRSPVDDFHWPVAGQAVQVLRSTATLSDADGTAEGYVAALNGEVALLASAYDPDPKTVRLPGPLPADYTAKDTTGPLYLRVWEELFPGQVPGTAITLKKAGMTVTLSVDKGFAPHVGDHWSIAARPDTPSQVYPERYLRAPQPPDGPRLWACPLYVIGVTEGVVTILDDCRHQFPPLTGIDGGSGGAGCCTLAVKPGDAVGDHLQALIHAAAAARSDTSRANRVTVCFEPGVYALEHPIELDAQHSNMELRGCSEAVVLTAAPGHEANFTHGLIVGERADNITITGFELQLARVPLTMDRAPVTKVNQTVAEAMDIVTLGLDVAIGIRPIHCAELEVSDCLFRFSVDGLTFSPDTKLPSRQLFGIGVFAASECWGLRLHANRFLHDSLTVGDPRQAPGTVLVGYLLGPTIISTAITTQLAGTGSDAILEALIDDAVIRDNTFDGISVAVYVSADLRTINVHNNTVRHCYGGVWLLDANAAADVDFVDGFKVPELLQTRLRPSLFGMIFDRYLALMRVVSATYPLPSGDYGTFVGVTKKSTTTGQKQQQDAMNQFLSDAANAFVTDPDPHIVDFNAGAESIDAIIGALPPAVQPEHRVNQHLTDIERSAALPAQNQLLRIRLTNNDIDCGSLDQGKITGYFGSAVYILSIPSPPFEVPSHVILANNRLTSLSADQISPVVGLFGIGATAVTGNVIWNVNPDGPSLFATTSDSFSAFTGNVIRGEGMLIPGRNFQPAGLETWLPLNSVTT